MVKRASLWSQRTKKGGRRAGFKVTENNKFGGSGWGRRRKSCPR